MGNDAEKSAERKEMVMENCICKGCPSYRDCAGVGGETELGFCLSETGKSGCIREENGCICDKCSVMERLGLKNLFFCTRGSEEEQPGK